MSSHRYFLIPTITTERVFSGHGDVNTPSIDRSALDLFYLAL
jgi:hypothetical protein